MKQAIRLSSLRTPLIRVRGHHTVDYLDGFWLNLFWDILIAVRRALTGRPPIKASSILESLSFKRSAFLLWILFWVLSFQPAPARTVYADPIITIDSIKPLQALKDPSYAPQNVLETMLHPVQPYGTYPNSFALGNCTFGVASRLPVPWSGNANEWAANAAAQGYTVSSVPKVGAIAASSTVYYLGHVGVVVNLNPLTIWEENYNGLYSVDERIINASDYVYIYF